MSYNILNIGKTGMKSMQNKMDGIADDLANINTHGYKKKQVNFQELLYNEIYDNEVLLKDGQVGLGINMGSKSGVKTIGFSQGILHPSSGKFHLAIGGEGFFGLEDKEGNLMLTRNGGFHINEDFRVTDDNGNSLSLDLNLPVDQWGEVGINIDSKGEITRQIEGQVTELAKVVLYKPKVLDSLRPLGEGRYLPSGDVELYSSLEQDEAFGNIIQYALEGSNVEIVKSMSDMITTQRAYSLNSRAIQATDDIMEKINNIKR